MLRKATGKDKPWTLGDLDEGHEWFAFTFNPQEATAWTQETVRKTLAESDKLVAHAYSRMALDSQHKWSASTVAEVDFIVQNLHLSPGDAVLDFGCGVGRHALELAKRGFGVLGVDQIDTFVEAASEAAASEGLSRAKFKVGDCRKVQLHRRFSAAVCLYDVIGSHPDDDDNLAMLKNLSDHLKPGGHVLISVMNLEMTEAIAKTKAVISEQPDLLRQLKPSQEMQKSGNVFDPDALLLDPATSLVYRKEQFSDDYRLPAELIVRDRRYRRSELIEMCRNVGLEEIWSRYAYAGHWNDTDIPARDIRAKEILFCGRKNK